MGRWWLYRQCRCVFTKGKPNWVVWPAIRSPRTESIIHTGGRGKSLRHICASRVINLIVLINIDSAIYPRSSISQITMTFIVLHFLWVIIFCFVFLQIVLFPAMAMFVSCSRLDRTEIGDKQERKKQPERDAENKYIHEKKIARFGHFHWPHRRPSMQAREMDSHISCLDMGSSNSTPSPHPCMPYICGKLVHL